MESVLINTRRWLKIHGILYTIKDFWGGGVGVNCLKAVTEQHRLKHLLKDKHLIETLSCLSHLLSLISGHP